MKTAAEFQIAYLELLRKENLLDLAIAGNLPPHIEAAAKRYIISSGVGAKVNQDKTQLMITAEAHDDVQREVYAYLAHYKKMKEVTAAVTQGIPRAFRVGGFYEVRFGHFMGRMVQYVGTDVEVMGCRWWEAEDDPISNKFLFRAQVDRVNLDRRVVVVHLCGERRTILLGEDEVGVEVQNK